MSDVEGSAALSMAIIENRKAFRSHSQFDIILAAMNIGTVSSVAFDSATADFPGSKLDTVALMASGVTLKDVQFSYSDSDKTELVAVELV